MNATQRLGRRLHVITCLIIMTACWLGHAAPVAAQAIRSTALTVKVLARDSAQGQTYTVKRAWVCVGDARNPRRYGTLQMANPTGEITFEGIPLGAEVLVTAWLQEYKPRGVRMTAQIPSRSLGARAEVVIEPSGGPTCYTPGLSKETVPTRTDPFIDLDQHPLKTIPGGPLVRSRELRIFNLEYQTKLISVNNAPTEYRTSQNSRFTGARWKTLDAHGGAFRSILHEITGSDGRKTVHVQFRNAAGTSPTYKVEFDFLDLYECSMDYWRARNALESSGTLGREQIKIRRAQSRLFDVAWPSPNESQPGYGMHLRRATNTGNHPIELSVGGGMIWNKVILEPGQWENFRADMRSVRCP